MGDNFQKYLIQNVFFWLLIQMFEREIRREKILDFRYREMKLKERLKSLVDGVKVS